MREIRTLRSTWRVLETWHGIGLNRRASPRPYLCGGRVVIRVPTATALLALTPQASANGVPRPDRDDVSVMTSAAFIGHRPRSAEFAGRRFELQLAEPVAASAVTPGNSRPSGLLDHGGARRWDWGLPATNRSTIDVNEVRTRIITDTSAPEAQGRIADLVQVAALRSQINSHPFDMIAVFRYPLVMQVEAPVGGR